MVIGVASYVALSYAPRPGREGVSNLGQVLKGALGDRRAVVVEYFGGVGAGPGGRRRGLSSATLTARQSASRGRACISWSVAWGRRPASLYALIDSATLVSRRPWTLPNGNTRAVQRYSRQRNMRILNLYDDNRTDLGEGVGRLVAANL